ncbi:MAG: PEP-CTERM sorting domain-containing protein [Pontiella sp.]
MKKIMRIGMVSFLVIGAAQAAPITWGSATTVAGDADVSTVGELLYAESWGLAAAGINGVDFTLANTGNISYVGGAQPRSDNVPSGITQSGGYYDLLRSIGYSADAGTSITLNNLIAGHTYDVQLWSSDTRYGATQNLWLDGSSSVSLSTRDGQYTLGSFTADATTQSITFLTAESGSASGIINAVQLRTTAIPEPATLGLLGAFGGGILFIRRRFRT